MSVHRNDSSERVVICLGDVMVDVITRLSGPLAVGSDTPGTVSLEPGGSAANTAAWLASAGARVTFVGRVGQDTAGLLARDTLAAAGLDLALSVDQTYPTGTCVVLVDHTGERTMIPDAGANASLTPADVPATTFVSGTHLHVSGYALFGGARPAALRALELARAAGMSISVGAASAAPLRAVGPELFLDLIGANVLLFANHEEAAVLGETTDTAAAARSLSARTGRAVVTCGVRGAFWSEGDRIVHEPAQLVEPLDTTGAGDAFAAGVLAAWLRGAGAPEALRAGHALGARAVARLGARPAREDGPRAT